MKPSKKTILVGIDYSKSSANAVRYAAMLAEKHKLPVTLFHAFEVPVVNTFSGAFFISYPQLKLSNQVKLNKYTQKLRKEFPHLEINSFVTSDSVKAAVNELDKKHSIFCLVIGLETKTKISKFIYGTTGTDIAGVINSPVIVVPQIYTKHKLEKAVVAVDNQNSLHAPVLKTCSDLKNTFKCKLSYLHVRTPEEILIDKKVITKAVPLKQVEATDLSSGLAAYNKQNKSDLNIIVSHKHSGFYRFFVDTNTKTIAFQSKIPALVIHD